MRKITLIVLLLTTVLCGRAQDFLTPESYGIYDFYKNGDETLFRLLVAGEKFEGCATWKAKYTTYYLCAPSFDPEYALVIEKNQLILNTARTSIWYALSEHKSIKEIPVNTKTLQVPEEFCEIISKLFHFATMTATNLESELLGFDGTYYYFNHRGKLASVWLPEGGRTARLVVMANQLCYAVEHHDTAVLNSQIEVCKSLTKEFKKDFPDRFFRPSWVSSRTGEEGPWSCELGGDNCMWLEIMYDTLIGMEACKLMSDLYSDSLAAWSREIFLMNDLEEYPTVVIDNQRVNPFCEVKTYNDHIVREITIPEQYWRRDVILQAAQLPPGQYYWVINGEWVNDKDLQPTSSSNVLLSNSSTSYPDCEPEFPGGIDSLSAFLKENVHRPEGSREADGTVLVEFVVEVDGSISEPKILKSLTPELDAEAIRVVKLMPKFIWHSEYCTVKRVYFNIPFKFVTE
jgi:TonB family protein